MIREYVECVYIAYSVRMHLNCETSMSLQAVRYAVTAGLRRRVMGEKFPQAIRAITGEGVKKGVNSLTKRCCGLNHMKGSFKRSF